MDANLARHFLPQYFFGNLAKIHVFIALDWLCSVSGEKTVPQNPNF